MSKRTYALFCPLDGNKLGFTNNQYRCSLHGLIAEVVEEWEGGEDTFHRFNFMYKGGIHRVSDVAQYRAHQDEVDFAANPDRANAYLLSQEPAVDGGNKVGDAVNNPGHYNQYAGFEVMDVAKQMGSPDKTRDSTWFRGNVFKYLARAGWKSPEKELEDLKKAEHYLNREIRRVTLRDSDFGGYGTLTRKSDHELAMEAGKGAGLSHLSPRCLVCDEELYYEATDKMWICPKGHGKMKVTPKVSCACPDCVKHPTA